MISDSNAAKPPSKVELIKDASNYLRGTILEGLADTSTGAISNDDTQLIKFHGSYQQDDRDLRSERRKQKLEKAFSFMIRVAVPGGICTPAQWLEIDRMSDVYGNGTMKLTTRQAFQLHGVLKSNLQKTIKEINESLLTTISACGDVNRNVMCNPNEQQSELHLEVYEICKQVSLHLTPKSKAYHEIWIDGKLSTSTEEEVEPIYGKQYMPRKFKIGFAIPDSNDVDVFTQDLGFISIIENNNLIGFNITAGGGMGMSHGKKETFPRLGDVLGFISKDKAVQCAESIVTTQRDFGDRTNRAHARLKYTIEDRGVDWFRSEVEKRAGFKFEEAKPFKFKSTTDRYGWSKGINGKWNLNLFIQNGRVKDTDDQTMKLALKEVAKIHDGDFRLTPNQNLIVANASEDKRNEIDQGLEKFSLKDSHKQTGLRLGSLACVALPTCGLSLAESERKLPEFLDDLDKVIEEAGLRDDDITIRMTGCPNGCARPYNSEIGLVGRAPGKYNLYLGGALDGSRLNKIYKGAVLEADLVGELEPIIKRYAKERENGEKFGDFCIRQNYVKACLSGREFHD